MNNESGKKGGLGMKKAIPIGHEDFREIIKKNLYYVDKSLLIKDIVDSGALVNLFTRPRRFGKTLNLSMIRRFFEDERTDSGEKIDNAWLFKDLSIVSAGEQYVSMQQKYPVISLSLKSAKQPSYQMAYDSLVDEIANEFERHRYILDNELITFSDKEKFNRIMDKTGEKIEYAKAVKFLSKCLEIFHGKKAIILIDEYDVPLENAYFRGFYDEMVDFIRSLFESALKTNDCLEFGVITGCLRISRESIFTGLNNLFIQSLRGTEFGEYFGFTQPEVDEILEYYDLVEKREEIKRWYDGYLIDGKEIYNPWSVLNYIKAVDKNPDKLPEPYWANTSSNDIIRELVENADFETRVEMESLIDGGMIEKPIHEDITYGDIHESMDNLWNFLFFTGYMKNCGEFQQEEQIYMKMCIPNLEIKSIYKRTILSWFDKKMKIAKLDDLYQAVLAGDIEVMGSTITEQLQETISFFDYAENYYHGFLAGLLKGLPGYRVVSNRESGDGRADLILMEKKFMGKAIILELKITDDFTKMESTCMEALEQINEKNYEAELKAEGCSEIIKYGICFFKKGCMVRKAK